VRIKAIKNFYGDNLLFLSLPVVEAKESTEVDNSEVLCAKEYFHNGLITILALLVR